MNMDADVIVLGAGLTGHCAALGAAQSGAKVSLIEKLENYGGSTLQAGGFFIFAGTDLQKSLGIEDNNAALRNDLMKDGKNVCDPALVDVFIARQLDAYNWLAGLQVKFDKISSSSRTIARMHLGSPPDVMKILHDRVMENNSITYYDNVAAHKLIVKAVGGPVTGILVEQDGKEFEVQARKGIIIATGGFSRNTKILQQFAPHLAHSVQMGGLGSSGDGLTMAFALGADHADMGYVQSSFGMSLPEYPEVHVTSKIDRMLFQANYDGAIIVNLKGQRFVDETKTYKDLGDYAVHQEKGMAIQIWDENTAKRILASQYAPRYNKGMGRGLFHQSNSIAELARNLQLDPSVIEATIKRYNGYVDSGVDPEFNRPATGYGKMERVDTAPFYAYPCAVGVTGTYCGLRIDPETRVLNVYGEVIPHLYAAGEVTGGFHGNGYVSGSSLSKSIVFGRLAGINAATRKG